MIVCGIKLTHDAGVALVDDGRLVFSIEMEKLTNNARHRRIDDLEVVFDLLRQFGYDPADVNRFVFDGWRNTVKAKPWGGQEIPLGLAPYRRGILDSDPLRPYAFRGLDLDYVSYTHYGGHIAAAYCSSPYARNGEPAYVLCWDGAMFPFLYRCDASGAVEDLGPLLYMLGDTYHTLAQLFPPFDGPIEWPHTLAIPGKVMAYIALGTPDGGAIAALDELYETAVDAELGQLAPPAERLSEETGRRILARMRDGLSVPGVASDDMIASVHEFLGSRLVEALVAAIAADGSRAPNICLIGGCALNIKWNRAIRDSGAVRDVWVPPFPNDSGSALGTACCELLRGDGSPALEWSTYAGPPLAPSAPLDGWASRAVDLAELAAILHETGRPVVYLDGRAELGPRALGHRSILAPAVDAAMKDLLNEVKGREPYRPVAPICLAHHAAEVFDPGTPDPYMLFDHDVRGEWRQRVPAVCHLDGTARIQTVTRDDEPQIFELLMAYERVSGIPLLCNTSANRNGSGFFPDVASAMVWNRVPAIWSEGVLYERESD